MGSRESLRTLNMAIVSLTVARHHAIAKSAMFVYVGSSGRRQTGVFELRLGTCPNFVIE